MKKYAILLLIPVLMTAGCERTIESKDPVRSVPEVPPTPTNIRVTVNAESLSLDWTVSDSSNIAKYRIYVSEESPDNFILHDSSSNSSATISNLITDRLYYIQVVSVDLTGFEGERTAVISATIGFTSMDINRGAKYTRSPDVFIQLNSSVPTAQMIVSEDPTFADASFRPYSPERSFSLSDGDGLKTVYARLVFTDGSESGELLQDEITLDTYSEIDSVFILPSATTFASGDVITFGLDAGDFFGQAAVSFTGVNGLEMFDDGTNGDDVAADGVYHALYEVPINSNLFHEVVTGYFTDAAGNTALPKAAVEFLNINTPPAPVDLGLSVNVLGEYQFTWGLSLEPDFESYRLYTSTSPGVTTSSNLVAIIADPLTSTYVLPAPGVTSYYRLFVFDQHGATAASNEVSR